jgi:hypothetical protein
MLGILGNLQMGGCCWGIDDLQGRLVVSLCFWNNNVFVECWKYTRMLGDSKR